MPSAGARLLIFDRSARLPYNRSARAGSARRQDRHPVLRRLPRRPEHGAGEWHGTKIPSVPGHETVGSAVGWWARISANASPATASAALSTAAASTRAVRRATSNVSTPATAAPTTALPGIRPATPSLATGPRSPSIRASCSVSPDNLPLDAAAPLPNCRITLYSLLEHWQAGSCKKVWERPSTS